MSLYYIFSNNFTPLENAMILILAISFAVQSYYYCFVFSKCYRYSKASLKGKIWYNAAKPPVSVIVYAKDDADQISNNLPKILEQKYPNFEVIVVNDASSDNTKESITLLENKYGNLYQTYIPNGAHSLSHKKLAYTIGIKAAKHDIIAFTDACCAPVSEMWLSTMMRNFTTDIEIVFGNTSDNDGQKIKWYYSYYRLFFKLKFLYYALINEPYMCEGTNMFIKKELFIANKGFSKHLSIKYGEDDIFSNEIMTRTNTKAEISMQATVIANNDNAAIEEIRLRRNFTNRFLKTSAKKFFRIEAFFAFTFYTSLFVLLFMGVYNNLRLLYVGLLLFFLRYIIQIIVIKRASKTLYTPVYSTAAVAYDIIRPFNELFFSIKGHNTNKTNYTWHIRK